jgi:hypothetical protein
MKDEDEPTAEELREAEALAAALAGKPADRAPPPEALETAALLRYAHGEGRLAPARQAALGERARGAAMAALRPRRRRLWWWLLLAPAAASAAMAVVVVGASSRQAPTAVATAPAPEPPLQLPPLPPRLVQAQAAAARGGAAALAALDTEMRAYRRALYHQLGAGRGGAR